MATGKKQGSNHMATKKPKKAKDKSAGVGGYPAAVKKKHGKKSRARR